jgi:mRNA interferase HigB
LRIISRKRIEEFWESRHKGSQKELESWYRVVTSAEWTNYSDAKQTYGARFDLVGDCGVFDIKNNTYRLITRMRFRSHKVFVLKIMTHAEYDQTDWERECGCHTPPPRPKSKKPR